MALRTPADDAPHILLVDDDSRIRLLLSSYLKENGYRVSEASTAGDAERKLSGLDFDLMILDVMMPGESGFDFASRLRGVRDIPHHPADCPVGSERSHQWS